MPGLVGLYAHAFGALPFRGHRQRLDRYDEADFDSYVAVMRQCGLWLYDPHEKRLYESHDGVATSREAYTRMGALDRS